MIGLEFRPKTAVDRVFLAMCAMVAAGAGRSVGLTDRECACMALGMAAADEAFQLVLDGEATDGAAARVIACVAHEADALAANFARHRVEKP